VFRAVKGELDEPPAPPDPPRCFLTSLLGLSCAEEGGGGAARVGLCGFVAGKLGEAGERGGEMTIGVPAVDVLAEQVGGMMSEHLMCTARLQDGRKASNGRGQISRLKTVDEHCRSCERMTHPQSSQLR
jgi:hypothetical protein